MMRDEFMGTLTALDANERGHLVRKNNSDLLFLVTMLKVELLFIHWCLHGRGEELSEWLCG